MNVSAPPITKGAGLCSGCGVCTGVCPQAALQMTVDGLGDLRPQVTGACNDCGRCTKVCPFREGMYNPRSEHMLRFSSADMTYHPDTGYSLNSYVGHVTDQEDRAASASGGLLTWTLQRLFRQQLITRAAVVSFSGDPTAELFSFVEARCEDDLDGARGSAYYPVHAADIVRTIRQQPHERWAIVGVPCLCAAIRRVTALSRSVPFVLGLACGMYQNRCYTELLVKKSGIDFRNLTGACFREKPQDSIASNYRFRATAAKKLGAAVPYIPLPKYLGKYGYFRLDACNHCTDVFAEMADACFMDAWLPGYREDPKGHSIVLIRNQAIQELVDGGIADGTLSATPLPASEVVRSQIGPLRRKRVLIHIDNKSTDDIETSVPTRISRFDRLQKWVQIQTAKRSKRCWITIGRRFGLAGFFLSMLDLWFLQQALDRVVPLIGHALPIFKLLLRRK